ncbi:MAG: hemerythrin domain-containing protein [Gemmatimonadetes bacterium]|nr:hemerythrin domain-containing protein [Gemmatimonadota bacterium]
MKWSEAFATGVSRIDDQHKMLFAMAADFRDALDESRGERVYAGLLESLELYVVSHFSYEEGCMARFVCPVAADNKVAHAIFVGMLEEFNVRYAARLRRGGCEKPSWTRWRGGSPTTSAGLTSSSAPMCRWHEPPLLAARHDDWRLARLVAGVARGALHGLHGEHGRDGVRHVLRQEARPALPPLN